MHLFAKLKQVKKFTPSTFLLKTNATQANKNTLKADNNFKARTFELVVVGVHDLEVLLSHATSRLVLIHPEKEVVGLNPARR